jgi:hypothetical protein
MMDSPAIIISALGIVATAVTSLIWIIKYLLREIKSSLDKNSASHDKVAKATEINTGVSKELLTFMKRLNGRLPQITAEKIKDER